MGKSFHTSKKTFRNSSRKCAVLGMLLAVALLCGYVESLIPFSFGIPGIKLGLANLVTVIALYRLGPKEALLISIARILLSGFLFGNMSAVVYSMAGGILSFLVMLFLKNVVKLNILSVSGAGGIFHNLGQLFVAALVVENLNLLYYMSILFFSGLVTGLLIGVASREVLKHLPVMAGKE